MLGSAEVSQRMLLNDIGRVDQEKMISGDGKSEFIVADFLAGRRHDLS